MAQTEILKASLLCLTAFDNLLCPLRSAAQWEGMSEKAIENGFGRFKVWRGSLGALKRGGSSLDARLTGSSVRDTVVLFLCQLQGYLEQSSEIQLARLRYGNFHRQRKQRFLKRRRINRAQRSEIQDIVDGLYDLSFTNRNTEYRSLSMKALTYKEIVPDSKQDLYECYVPYDRLHVEKVLEQFHQEQANADPKHSTPAFLANRLIKATTNRIRCFGYWRTHAQKLPQIDLAIADQESGVENPSGPERAQAPSENPDNKLEEKSCCCYPIRRLYFPRPMCRITD
ncbi:uncharacterized protein BDV17DRAFT_296636 [Aspergillus undulatus]|uniref:uncharacterized protein n=1 Tax=Aspergillus undulatus TaxID=1810928 RepID=UPI003CCE0FAA